jgi:hypothetical protein
MGILGVRKTFNFTAKIKCSGKSCRFSIETQYRSPEEEFQTVRNLEKTAESLGWAQEENSDCWFCPKCLSQKEN